jgi:hypothetical protein
VNRNNRAKIEVWKGGGAMPTGTDDLERAFEIGQSKRNVLQVY